MANRRMISKDIYLDDKFSDLPVTTRLLYTYCDLLADDDGFISSVKQAMFFSNAFSSTNLYIKTLKALKKVLINYIGETNEFMGNTCLINLYKRYISFSR